MSDYQIIRWENSEKPDSAKLRQQMKQEGYSVFQWSDSIGAIYSEHFHGNDQSHWIISGSLELTIKEVGTFILNAGDRDFMPAKTYHSARVVSDEPVVYLIGEKIS
ncbi:MAG: cupin domain-containing protein [Pyrinomonadaceae bacterium]|nr:cupin domain-containing protein [Pyrinomonadaceae bacterium]